MSFRPTSEEHAARLAYIDMAARLRLAGAGYPARKTTLEVEYINGLYYLAWNAVNAVSPDYGLKVTLSRYPIPGTLGSTQAVMDLDPNLVARRLAEGAVSLLEAHRRMRALPEEL